VVVQKNHQPLGTKKNIPISRDIKSTNLSGQNQEGDQNQEGNKTFARY
jgi:hypothetical protein